jgi:hypothetical protein
VNKIHKHNASFVSDMWVRPEPMSLRDSADRDFPIPIPDRNPRLLDGWMDGWIVGQNRILPSARSDARGAAFSLEKTTATRWDNLNLYRFRHYADLVGSLYVTQLDCMLQTPKFTNLCIHMLA